MIIPLIITRNEAKHITRLLNCLSSHFSKVLIIDSYSDDGTVELARNFVGVEVLQRQFTGYADQLNYGIDILEDRFNAGWFFRLDADEEVSPLELRQLTLFVNQLPDTVSAVSVKRKFIFMGKEIRFGGYGNLFVKRIGRLHDARFCADRMDEVLISKGLVRKFNLTIYDNNLSGIDSYLQKHIRYSDLELEDFLDGRPKNSRGFRAMYYRLPAIYRSISFFFFRYFIRLGFIGGRETFYFIFFQTLFYRVLVDYKMEFVRKIRRSG